MVPAVVLPATPRQKSRHVLSAVLVVRAEPCPLNQHSEGLNVANMHVAPSEFAREVDYGVLVVSCGIPVGV